jgi:uncharacterized protein (TIGR02996 family)
MMDQEEAFLAAVLAEPDNDAVRLVYADWLEERGDPRAEFIRVQCALAKKGTKDPRRAARERELLAAYEGRWTGRLPDWVRAWRFRRGFIEEVSVDVPTLLTRGGELFRLAPVRSLRLLQAGGFLDGLAAWPHLARLSSLDISGNWVGAAGAEILAGSPYLAGLAVLNLRGTGLDARGVQALAASPHLAGLRVLDLSDNDIGAAGLRAVANSPHLGRLAPLTVHYDKIDAPSQQALQQRFGPRLEFLPPA